MTENTGRDNRGRSGGVDFEAVNARALERLADLVATWAPDGRWEGAEWSARNPTRSDNKPGSFKINTETGAWSDFATGDAGGDPVSLYAYIHGHRSQADAARALAAEIGLDGVAENGPGTREGNPGPYKAERNTERNGAGGKPDWHPIVPVPEDAPDPPDEFRRNEGTKEAPRWVTHYVASRWAYRDGEGTLLGYVCRIDYPDGSKDVVPQTWCEDRNPETDRGRRWAWKSLPEPRPLYGLDRLAAKPGTQVVLVEGEKAADAAQRLMPGPVVVTWPGGGKAINKADWSALNGRKVVIWPDADEAGQQTAEGWLDANGRAKPGLAQLIEQHAVGVRVVDPPPNVPEGWDLADAEAEMWTGQQVADYIRHNLREPREPSAEPEEAPEPPVDAYDVNPDTGQPPPEPDPAPFRCLGYAHGTYYYLPRGTQQIMGLTAQQHRRENLIALAPLQWWERQYPGKSGADWAMATNALMRRQEQIGVFDGTRIRGRGAWLDNERVVLHLGNQLQVNGESRGLMDIETPFVYEAGPRLDPPSRDAASNAEAHQLVQVADSLHWERPVNGKLLAGWIALAPVCGALAWRPHIWVTGPSGSGKSWVMDHVVQPMIGSIVFQVLGNTSEAGIRQSLGQDARPVLYDEAEGETRAARSRIQTILELMRQASTETGAAIVKGSQNGAAQLFRIRSMFCLSSVGVNLQQKADTSRTTILSLTPDQSPGAPERFEQLEEFTYRTVTEEFAASVRARILHLIPVIRENARIFGKAAAEHLGSQRLGDQYGTLLAGAYALHSKERISLEAAREWVRAQDWSEPAEAATEPDEYRCLSELMQHTIRIPNEHGKMETLSMAEAVAIALGRKVREDLSLSGVEEELGRQGIRVNLKKQRVVVSNSHASLRDILAETPWANNWAQFLRRIPGAESKTSYRFAENITRAVSVPADVIFQDTGEGAPEEE